MTDLTLSPSAQRFAAFLDREYCVWLPSPSMALLAALITGKGRPKRLLVQENAPAFISNIGLVTGAASVKVRPSDIDRVIEGLLRDEGLSPNQIWGVATHRDGKLTPTDWLSTCAASGIPTIELCMGSVFALARWGASPAMFTLVDLEAEEAFAGARLTALLTGDRAKAARVEKLCLPGPEAQDYVLDAWPRGLAHDEPALVSLVERVTAQGSEAAQAPGAPALTLPLTRPFPSASVGAPPSQGLPKAAPALVDDDRWRTRLAEAEARHTEALRIAEANASSLQSRLEEQKSFLDEGERRLRAAEKEAASRAERDALLLSESLEKLEERQRTIDQWEVRFRDAEAEAERDAALVSRARTDLLRGGESERALASMQAERDALLQKLTRTERERDLAVADAGQKEEAERRMRSELRQRVDQFEGSVASQALAAAQVARLEKEAAELGKVRDGLLKQKTEAEQALASSQAEKKALALKLADLDAELSEALTDAAKRTAEQRAALAEQVQRAARLEEEVAARTKRDATQSRARGASQKGLTAQIAALETEKASLAARLSAIEKDREQKLAEAARREETQRSAAAEERKRAERLEAETAALKERQSGPSEQWVRARTALEEKISRLEAEAGFAEKTFTEFRKEKGTAERALSEARAEAAGLKEREARLTEEWAAERSGLSGQIKRLEAAADTAQKALAELLAEKAKTGPALAQARAEAREASDKLAESERAHARALADEAKNHEASRVSLGERITRLEAEVALAEGERKDLQASLLSEKEALSRKVTAVESERDRATAEAEKRGEALHAALEEQRQRAEQPEADPAAASAREASMVQAWESERFELAERIARLEASAVETASAHQELVRRMETDASQAVAATRTEGEALARKLAGVEKDRDLARAEAARSDETQRAALEEQRQRAAKFEAELAARNEREAQLTDEWALLRAELSARIARMEAAAVAAEKARADIFAQKAEGEVALESLRAERDALSERLAGIEREHSTALAAAVRREESQRLSVETERRRAEQFERDAASALEREEKLSREWEAARIELVAQIARSEAREAVADKARTELLNRKRDSEQALAAAQDERVELLKKLAAAEHDREQALARTAANEESPKESVKGAASLPEANTPPAKNPPQGDAPKPAGERNTGGLSALVSLWDTSVIRRPLPRKEPDGNPSEPPLNPAFDIDVITGDAPPSSPPAVALEPQESPAPDLPAQAPSQRSALLRESEVPEGRPDDPAQSGTGHSSAKPEEPFAGATESRAAQDPAQVPSPKVAATQDSRGAASASDTGGLSALVNLWNTAVIRRPLRNKETEEKPPEPAAEPVFGLEEISTRSPSSGPAPVHETRGPLESGVPHLAEAEAPALPNEPATQEPAPQHDAAAGARARRPADRGKATVDAASTGGGKVPPKPPAPTGGPDAPRPRNTGGLAALVNLWNTATTKRPSRRKIAEEQPADPLASPVFGVEVIPDAATPPSGSAPLPGAEGQGKAPEVARPGRPAQASRPRLNPSSRQPPPKPAAVADDTENLGGWLRGLASRFRGKP